MSDLVDVISMGPFGSDITVDNYVSSGVPVLNGSNISGVKLRDGFTNYLTLEKAKSLKKANAQRGDIIVTHRGTLGQISYIPEDSEFDNYVISQSQFRVKLKTDLIDPVYFTYYFHTSEGQKRLLSFKNHVGVPALAQATTNFRLLEIPYIAIDTQIQIAKVLSDLDAKIELNNKINVELEAMAKLIYDYWFVQFDFPAPSPSGRAGVRSPYKSSGGKMVYNEELKREIPEGWGVKPLSDWIANYKSGDWGKESLEGNYTEEVSCIRGADINGLNGKGEVKAPTRFILEKNRHKILEPGDLIIEISGGSPTQSTGRMAFITKRTLERFDVPLICSNFCKALTLKEEKSLFNFAFKWNRLYDAGVLFGWEGKTSGIKNLLFESFVSKHLDSKPPQLLMDDFYERVEPIQDLIQKNIQQNQQLATLRDWLLPMLMNGQVRFSSAKATEDKLSMAAEGKLGYNKR